MPVVVLRRWPRGTLLKALLFGFAAFFYLHWWYITVPVTAGLFVSTVIYALRRHPQ